MQKRRTAAFTLGYAQGTKAAKAEFKKDANKKKQITLSDQEARQLDIFLELTSGRISEELTLWESMKGKTPNAEKNIVFWKETSKVVEKLRSKLR